MQGSGMMQGGGTSAAGSLPDNQLGAQFNWNLVGEIVKTALPIVLSSLQAQPGQAQPGFGQQSAGFSPMSAGPGQSQLGAQFNWNLVGEIVKTALPIVLSSLQAQPGFGQQSAGFSPMSTGPGQVLH
jgi:hypothetical protein